MELVTIHPSQSSQLAAVGFDGVSKMHVLFRRGGLYEYSNVSVHEYNDVLTAPKAGDVFRDKIKGIKPFRKIESETVPTTVIDSFLPSSDDKPRDPAPASPEPLPIAASADPKVQQVSKQSTALVEQAKCVSVVSAEAQEKASELLLTVAAMRREIAETFKPMKDAAFKSHRTICDQEKTLDAPLLEAEKLLKWRIGEFISEQQRIAREQEAEARRQLQAQADEEARRESERLAIEDAVALEEEGRHVEAEAVLANPLPVAPRYTAPAPVAAAVANVKGVSSRQVAKFRIVDESKLPREYMMPNESAIRAVVSRTDGKIKIAGVEVYFEQQIAASRRA